MKKRIEEVVFKSKNDENELAKNILNEIEEIFNLDNKKDQNFEPLNDFNNIGICGNWGIGKTTFIKNRLLKDIKKNKKLVPKYLSVINIMDNFSSPDTNIKNNFYDFLLNEIEVKRSKFWMKEFILTIPIISLSIFTVICSTIWTIFILLNDNSVFQDFNESTQKYIVNYKFWLCLSIFILITILFALLSIYLSYFFVKKQFVYKKKPHERIQKISKKKKKKFIFIIDDLNRIESKDKNINLEMDVITKLASFSKADIENNSNYGFVFLFVTSKQIFNIDGSDFIEKFFKKVYVFEPSEYILKQINNNVSPNEITLGLSFQNYRKFEDYLKIKEETEKEFKNLNSNYFDLDTVNEINILKVLKYHFKPIEILLNDFKLNKKINYFNLKILWSSLYNSNFNSLSFNCLFENFIWVGKVSDKDFEETEKNIKNLSWIDPVYAEIQNKIKLTNSEEEKKTFMLQFVEEEKFDKMYQNKRVFENADKLISFNNVFTYKYLINPLEINILMENNDFNNMSDDDKILRMLIEIQNNLISSKNIWDIIEKSEYLKYYFLDFIMDKYKFNGFFENLLSFWYKYNEDKSIELLKILFKTISEIVLKKEIDFSDLYEISTFIFWFGIDLQEYGLDYLQPKSSSFQARHQIKLNTLNSVVAQLEPLVKKLFDNNDSVLFVKKMDEIISKQINSANENDNSTELIYKISFVNFVLQKNFRLSYYCRFIEKDKKTLDNINNIFLKAFGVNASKEIILSMKKSIISSIKNIIKNREDKSKLTELNAILTFYETGFES